MIWEKTQATGHLNAKKMPMKAHENILVFYKNPPTYNPQKTTGHTRKISRADQRKTAENCELYGNQKERSYDSTERYPRSVVKFSSDKQISKFANSTQKPLKLIEYGIQTYSNPGDIVLDSACGTGTTGEACQNTGRDFILIEKDPKMFEIACKRVGQFL